MPDDCGLKPPIETLPQIAQERAMVSSEIDRVVGRMISDQVRARTRGHPGPEGAGGAV
jgi:hypothetical protein